MRLTLAILLLAFTTAAYRPAPASPDWTCTTAEEMACSEACTTEAPANCAVVEWSCHGGWDGATCDCELFCTIVSYDPMSGGMKHMAVVLDNNNY